MSAGTVTPNIFDRLAIAFGRTTKAAPPTPGQFYPPAGGVAYPISWEGWPDRGGTGRGLSPTGGAGLHQSQQDEQRARAAVQSVWVYACCQAIANEFSTAEIVIQERRGEEDEEVSNAPFEKLWEHPNPFMGRGFMMQFWAWSLLLSGEAYLFARPVNGEVVELWPVPPWRIAPLPHPRDFISGYAFQPAQGNGEPVIIDRRYICYTRLPNPFDPHRGLSPLAAAWVATESDLAMAKWNKNFFSKENAAPTGIISVPRDTLDTDLARVRTEIADFFGSGQRRVGVARAGDLVWTPFDRSQKDMEFLQGRTMARDEIMIAFGIPIGYFSDKANRANAEQARATMIENAVWPRLELLREDLNAQWGGTWWDEEERATFKDIRPRNMEAELAELAAVKDILTLDELRALRKEDPIGDYRGLLLLKEIEKAAAMPATPAAKEVEDTLAEAEAALAAEEAAAGVTEAQPAGGAPLAEQTPSEGEGDSPALEAEGEALKAREIAAWRRAALNDMKRGKRPAPGFECKYLTSEEAAPIRAALEAAEDADAVKAAFTKADDLDALLEAQIGPALTWARLALASDERNS